MWHYQGQEVTEIPEKAIAFVYIIVNLDGGKSYLGKKNLYFTKTKQVKGKKKKYLVESDWKEYTGSNDELNAEIAERGLDKYKKEVLRWCYTKSEATYFEAKYQFQYEVLENPDKWYNGWIMCRVRSAHLKSIQKGTLDEKQKDGVPKKRVAKKKVEAVHVA